MKIQNKYVRNGMLAVELGLFHGGISCLLSENSDVNLFYIFTYTFKHIKQIFAFSKNY